MSSRKTRGVTNAKSGKNWTKAELLYVLHLFVHNPDLKIHEYNSNIISLAQKLSRTTRSVEAQLLMFKNLSDFGKSTFQNKSRLIQEVWDEYVDSQIK